MIREFLGNTQASSYKNVVDVMLQNFQALDARMSIKLHYLFSHLDYFPKNLGDVSEKQGKRFKTLGRWQKDTKVVGTHMMADYCWTLIRDCTEQSHSQKSYKRTCFEMPVKIQCGMLVNVSLSLNIPM